ncbi:hypothetical protein MMC29_007876, partial [Sticta canariensis]|nr:hypothetical protein [Sticta canariensis]
MSPRKRQTRLTFTPLPSSSPAAKAYPAQIQQRGAAVCYEDFSSPTRKGRIAGNLPVTSHLSSNLGHTSQGRRLRSGNISLPTPEASSQVGSGTEQGRQDITTHYQTLLTLPGELDREVVSPSPNSPSQSTKTFGRFARISKSKPKSPSTPEASRKPGVNVASPQIAGYHTNTTEWGSVQVSFEPGTSQSTHPSRQERGKSPRVVVSISDDDSDPVVSKPNRAHRNISPWKERSLTPGYSIPSKSQKRVETLSPAHVGRVTKEDRVAPPKRNTRSFARNNRSFMMADHGTLKETETDDSEDPVRSPSKRLRRRPSFSNSTDHTMDELAGTTRHPPSRTNRKNPAPISITTTSSTMIDDSSDDAVITPRRRLRTRNEHSPKINSDKSEEQAADDLREDLKYLRESGGFCDFPIPTRLLLEFFTYTKVEVRKRRTRGTISTPKKVEKQKQLEMLRRHHARGKVVDLSSDNETPLKKDHQADEISEDEDEDEDEDSGTEAVRQSLYTNADEYEEDFVDDEDVDGTLGAPLGLEEIPLEFTAYASKKPIEYFKIAVEWMVHNKLNPAFARDDMLYQIAVRKLDDEVQGFAGSKFVSSVWKEEFTMALKSRPEIEVYQVPVDLEHNCEACRRGGHPAKYQVIFKGKPYNRTTLEEISEDEDYEDEDEKSSEGQESYQFYLGRTCKANAETAHSLHHWRIQLNFYVLTLLRNNGHLSAEKILERERWNTKKREKYSNAVVDGMESSGEMRNLYKEFKEDLEAARSAT